MNNDYDQVWVLTQVVDDVDSAWDLSATLVAAPAKMAELVDLHRLPFGTRLLKGKQARRFLKWSQKQEARWQREQKLKRQAGGAN